MKFRKILLVGLMTATVAGCEVIQALMSNKPVIPEIPPPIVTVYETEAGGVCFSPEDASSYFRYVYDLEMVLEDLR